MTPALKDTTALKDDILAENRRVHTQEGALYLARHPEQTNVFIKRVRKKVLSRLYARLNGPKANVLDLGCGTGYLFLDLLARGCRMTGVDLSRDMLAALSERIAEATQSNLVEADVEAFLKKATEPYDAIVCSAFLHHLYDYKIVLTHACRLLKPGGTLLIFFEPLKQEIASPVRYRLHRVLARLDEGIYRLEMRCKGIPVFQEDYSLSDYQRRFGGIDPAVVLGTLKSKGLEILEMKTHCARRYGLSAWIATSLLRTHNTFHLLAQKSTKTPAQA